MDDTTKAIFDRIRQCGLLDERHHGINGVYRKKLCVNIGGVDHGVDKQDATAEDARNLADLAGVDVSDIK